MAGAGENFIAFQTETLESYLPAVESEFRHRIENFFLKGLAARCFDRSSECLQIAGGGPRGDTWYADYVNEATNELTIDIIDCYKATLQEVDTQQIDELLHQSRQAPTLHSTNLIICDCQSLVVRFPNSILTLKS